MNAIQFLEALLSVSVQAAMVITATEWLGLRTTAAQRSRLWTGCYCVLLLLLASAAALPHLRWLPGVAWADADVLPLVEFQSHLGGWMFLIWITGGALSLVLLAARMWLTARFLATCKPLPAADLTTHCLDVTEAGRRPIRWLSSPGLPGPFCWQFHQPCVVLPDHLLEMNSDDLAMVLRHEVEHLRTQHPRQLFLQHLVETLLWFHPLVWLASRRAALARELVCDEAAVKAPAEVVSYLRILLRIVERQVASSSLEGACLGLARDRGLLKDRAHRLVQIAQRGGASADSRTARGPMLAGVALAAAALWLPVNGLASPRAAWSPWPRWSAGALHRLGVRVRDYEVYDRRLELHDLRRSAARAD